MKSWGNAINGSLPKWNAAGCSDNWRHRPRNPHVRLCEPLSGLLRGGAVSLPQRRISSRFRADFRGFLRLCGGQEQGSRRSPAKRVRWEEETQRNERVFAAFGRNEGYGACADEKQDKNFKTGARAPVFLRDRLSGTVQIRTVGGSIPPLQYPSPHSILQSRLKCGIIAHGKDVRIILLKKIYCRMFQACFGLGARVLPWRRPECITGAGSLQASGGAGGCAGSVPHREPDGEVPDIY